MADEKSDDNDDTVARRDRRRALAIAGGAHALHDGYSDLISLMLPIWQAEFALAYGQVGMLRTLFSGTMAGFQIPAASIAERFGLVVVLAAGTALAGAGYCLAGLSGGLISLIVALAIAGLGASTQHPLASTLVARHFSGARTTAALGTYNFTGDLGKMTVPAVVALLIALGPWRVALTVVGLVGLVAAIAIFTFASRLPGGTAAPKAASADATDAGGRGGFALLLAIGVVDTATRNGFLTFLPFLLIGKGASVAAVGLALTAVFAGGACGKLVCAVVGARIGVFATVLLTETLTAVLILALMPLPLWASYLLLPVIGIALNGTSSVLYGSVPRLVSADRRTRAFSIFYTGTIGAGALAPTVYGLLGDAIGLSAALVVVATVVLITLPLAVALRSAMTEPTAIQSRRH
jgi:MFS transporter, FSR family, fosmidomycin resistance protein